MKRNTCLLMIVLTAAFFAHAQTADNLNQVENLTPLSKGEETRYKRGIRKKQPGELPPHYMVTQSRCRTKIEFESNIEFANIHGRHVAIFIYAVASKELVYEPVGGQLRASADILGRVRGEGKTFDAGFEGELVDLSDREALIAAGPERRMVFRKQIELPPGAYRADTTFRDRTAGCRGRSSRAFTIPVVEQEGPIQVLTPIGSYSPWEDPFLSTLILGTPVEKDAPPLGGTLMNMQYVRLPRSGSRVRDPGKDDDVWIPQFVRMLPSASGNFRQGKDIIIFYRFDIPIESECMTNVCGPDHPRVEFTISRDGKTVSTFSQDWSGYWYAGTQEVMATFPTAGLAPGKYSIAATVKERTTGKSFSRSDVFEVIKEQK